MTYKHMPVGNLEAHHNALVDMQRGQIHTVSDDYYATRALEVVDLDGVAVTKPLADVCLALRRIHKDIKFGVGADRKYYCINQFDGQSRVWVYFPGDLYARVRISYGHHAVKNSVTTHANPTYAVYSRKIANEKYHEYRDHYNMAVTGDPKKFMALVSKNMVPYDPLEVAQISFDSIHSMLSNTEVSAREDANYSKRQVSAHPQFVAELRYLVNSGHEFMSSEFEDAVRHMLSMHDAQHDKVGISYHGYFVQVRTCGESQSFDVVTVPDILLTTQDKLPRAVTHTLDTLPGTIPGRIAALSMLGEGAFVEGVGYRDGETTFWVLE